MEEEEGAEWGVPRGTGCEGEEESGGRQTAFTLGHTLGSAVLGSPVLATRVPHPLQGPGHFAALAARRAVYREGTSCLQVPRSTAPEAPPPAHLSLVLQVPNVGWGAGGHRLWGGQAAEALGSLPGHSSPRGPQGRRVAGAQAVGAQGQGSAGLGQAALPTCNLVTSPDPRVL